MATAAHGRPNDTSHSPLRTCRPLQVKSVALPVADFHPYDLGVGAGSTAFGDRLSGTRNVAEVNDSTQGWRSFRDEGP
jgi:hypothetical protein